MARITGMLLGALLGDALGRPFEGFPARDLKDLELAVRRRAATPRHWGHSDDGEMTLALAESLVRCGDLDERDLLATLARSHDVTRGYGKGTRAAFRWFEDTGDWQNAGRALWRDGSRGNGAAARVAPVATLSGDEERVAELARRSAVPTHMHPDAIGGAELIARAAHRALRGEAPAVVVATVMTPPVFADPMKRARAARDASPADAVRALGHGTLAIDSVPLALWAFARATSFEAAVVDAVSLGGDTDTIGAMVGALAGASFGVAAIPESWIDALEPTARTTAEQLAAALAR